MAESWTELGLSAELSNTLLKIGWYEPKEIQRQSIPLVKEKLDVIGVAETGSGKTGAFALPMIDSFIADVTRPAYYGLILVPARELANQIMSVVQDVVNATGEDIITLSLIGGSRRDADTRLQKMLMSGAPPNIVVATPGKMLSFLKDVPGLATAMSQLKYLVFDEADRLFNTDFMPSIREILQALPPPDSRQTMLFSATMGPISDEVQGLTVRSGKCRKVAVDAASTVRTLVQALVLAKNKDLSLLHILQTYMGAASIGHQKIASKQIVFCNSCAESMRVALMINSFFHQPLELDEDQPVNTFTVASGLRAVPLNGEIRQSQREEHLRQFTTNAANVLVATDVAARGLDIPAVRIVVNYDAPGDVARYIHRVGRTARAGSYGKAVTLVQAPDLQAVALIEQGLGRQIDIDRSATKHPEEMIRRCSAAGRDADNRLRDMGFRGKRLDRSKAAEAMIGNKSVVQHRMKGMKRGRVDKSRKKK